MPVDDSVPVVVVVEVVVVEPSPLLTVVLVVVLVLVPVLEELDEDETGEAEDADEDEESGSAIQSGWPCMSSANVPFGHLPLTGLHVMEPPGQGPPGLADDAAAAADAAASACEADISGVSAPSEQVPPVETNPDDLPFTPPPE